jgi:hypothetical protein
MTEELLKHGNYSCCLDLVSIKRKEKRTKQSNSKRQQILKNGQTGKKCKRERNKANTREA